MADTTVNQIDLATAKLTQAQGVLNLLTSSGHDGERFGNATHRDVMATHWVMQDLLDGVQTAFASLETGRA